MWGWWELGSRGTSHKSTQGSHSAQSKVLVEHLCLPMTHNWWFYRPCQGDAPRVLYRFKVQWRTKNLRPIKHKWLNLTKYGPYGYTLRDNNIYNMFVGYNLSILFLFHRSKARNSHLKIEKSSLLHLTTSLNSGVWVNSKLSRRPQSGLH